MRDSKVLPQISPFIGQDIYEAWKTEGYVGAGISIPASVIGLGQSTYETSLDKRNVNVRLWAKEQGISGIDGYQDLLSTDRRAYTEGHKQEADALEADIKSKSDQDIKWAVSAWRRIEIQNEAVKNQTADDALLSKFFSKEPGAISPQVWNRRRKDRAIDTAARKDELFKELNTKEPETPTDRYYTELERLEEKSNGVMSPDSWDNLDRWIASQPTEDRKYIENDARGGAITPMVEAWYLVNKVLEPYYQVKDQILLKYPKDVRDEITPIWKEYINEPSKIRKDQLKKNSNGVIAGIERDISIAQDMMRTPIWDTEAQNKRASLRNALLIRWNISTKITSEAGFQEVVEALR